MRDVLRRLQEWYLANCNGDWEHTYGVTIETLDNPGWALTVDLEDTYLMDVPFEKVQIQRGEENDWILCRKDGFKFQGDGGPENLEEIIQVFLTWAHSNKNEKDT
jgi:hypothetical protein